MGVLIRNRIFAQIKLPFSGIFTYINEPFLLLIKFKEYASKKNCLVKKNPSRRENMGNYIRHHKYELSILGMPWKKVSVIKDKDMGQRGEAMDYEGESFENLDKKAWERMKQDK
jgi:hypothetical protein